ncbi:MAG: murein biosynthesis integral membrane protein MurJ [Gemmatimonadota bacterium]
MSAPADAVIAPPTPPGGSARFVAAGILLSRVAGFLRESVMANYLGTSAYADVFRAALRMPNVLQNLLGEGTLSASFIPVYARLLEQGRREEAGRFAGAMFSLLLVVAAARARLGSARAPQRGDVFMRGFAGPKRDLAVVCVRIIFPMTGVLVLSAWALGVLNSHRQFFVPYVAPVLWNAAIIGTLLFFGGRMSMERLTIAASWGALAGGGLQFLMQLPWVLRLERDLRAGVDTTSEHIRTTLRNAGPVVMGRGVVQLSGWLDLFIASFLPGALAVLGYAQTLYLLPISLFGMSVAAAELPELARADTGAVEVLRDRVRAGLRRIALVVIPAVVGYLLLGDVIVAALYQRGSFTAADTVIVSLTLAAYSIGLFAATATRLLSSAFFALRDTRTPARIAIARVVLAGAAGGLSTILIRQYWPEYIRYGAVPLAAAAGLAAWFEWIMLRKRLAERLGHVPAGRGAIVRMLLAAALAALVAKLLGALLPAWPAVLLAVVLLAVFGILYFALAALFGIEDAAPGRILRVLRR